MLKDYLAQFSNGFIPLTTQRQNVVVGLTENVNRIINVYLIDEKHASSIPRKKVK